MPRTSFNQFVSVKNRKAKKHLIIIKNILELNGLSVKSHLEEESDPFIYVVSPNNKLSFGGIRIYEIDGVLAYKIQKEENTHPYGKAYPLDIEGIYDEIISEDGVGEGEAGNEVMELIGKEINHFFKKSYEAERENRLADFDLGGDPLGRVMMRQSATDYTNTMPGTNFK